MTQTAKQQPKVPPQVIALHGGYYASVDGRLFGPWACKEYAQAGLAIEIRRADKRAAIAKAEGRAT